MNRINGEPLRTADVIRFCLFALILFIPPGLLKAQEGAAGWSTLDSLLDVRISTVSKYEQTAGEAPAAVTIVTADEISRFGYRTLSEILENIRGFYLTNDRLLDFIGTRGFNRTADNNNRLLLMINGHTVNENYFGSSFFGNDFGLNLDAVERIEIVRGPGSVLYGTSAMFAVINVITRDGGGVDGMEVYGELGSFGRKTAGVTAGHQAAGGPDFMLSGRMTRAEGQDLYFPEYDFPATNNGVAEDADWERQQSLLATASWGDFSFQGYLNARKKGVPTAPWYMDFNDPFSYFYEEFKFGEFKYQRSLATGQELMLRGYYDHYGQRGSYRFGGIPAGEKFAENHYGGEARYLWDPRPYLRIIAGTELQKHPRAFYRSWDPQVVYYEQNHPFHAFSAYLQQEIQLHPTLLLSAGLRHERYASRSSSTVPRVALVWDASPGRAVKLLYGMAFRAPNVYEMYYEVPYIAEGNPDLRPEKIETLELVAEGRLTRGLHGSVSIYNNTMRDFIEQVEATDEHLSRYVNTVHIRARGAEAGLRGNLFSWCGAYLNYSYQFPRKGLSGERLPNSPRHIVQAGASASFKPGLTAALQCRYSSSRRSDKNVTSDSFTLFDLNLSGNIVPERLRFAFKVRNLFDAKYAYPAGLSLLQELAPQDGRTIVLRLECGF